MRFERQRSATRESARLRLASALFAAAVGLLGCLPLCAHAASGANAAPAEATVIRLDGAIGPAMSRYVDGAIADAQARQDALIVLQMDTPGGLDTAMRDIIETILASPVPIVGYVAPSGARAASAGTYILYACPIAAMAPATNVGAATPISLGGQEQPSAPVAPTKAPASTSGASNTPAQNSPGTTASERKAVNDAVAYIRSLADLHGRDADWAEAAVRGAASLPAQEAVSRHVVDFLAPDLASLFHQLDGRRVTLAGHTVTLHTSALTVKQISPDWRTQLLLVLSHPTIAYGLLLAGIWGLLLEGYHPGGVLPGVVGALALLLALYGLQLLGVNFAGLALMALGVGLIITEFFMPTYGSLGVGGLAAFVIGSIILFNHNRAGLAVALPLIAGIAIAGALVIGLIVALATRAQRAPIATGTEAMVGSSVEVVGEHLVRYGGELWQARAPRPLEPGQQARIVKVSGLTLWVEPQEPTPDSHRRSS